MSPSTIGDSTPLFIYKEFVHKHLSQGFPIDPKVILTLKLSLLKLSKSTNPNIASASIKEIYNKIALFLSDLGFAY